MGLTAEVPGRGTVGRGQFPLDDGQLLISALNHKPMDRTITGGPANLALKLLQARHAFSSERWLGKEQYSENGARMIQITYCFRRG
jgi:hypothetical protein